MQTLITWYQTHELFFIIYILSSVIGYFAISHALKSERYLRMLKKEQDISRRNKIKLYTKIILIIFVHIPYVNVVYAVIYIILFTIGLFKK